MPKRSFYQDRFGTNIGKAQNREAFLQVLDGYTLAELITNDTELRGLLLPASA